MKFQGVLAGWLGAGSLLIAPLFAQPDPPAAPRPRHVTLSAARTAYIGLGVAEIDADRAKALNLKEERGVEVKSVTDDGPAEKAGIRVGDVVLEYNGQRVEGIEQFIRMVRETPVGRQTRLLISRGGNTQTVTATIGSRPGSYIVSGDGHSFAIPSLPPVGPAPPEPPMPPMPFMPDMPRSMMAWRSGALGVETESLNPQLAAFFGVKDGVLVRSVVKDSAAEKAGIKAGDVIVKVDGTAVTNAREISSVLRGMRGSKRTIPLVIVRDRKEMTVNVTLDDSGSMRPVRAGLDAPEDV